MPNPMPLKKTMSIGKSVISKFEKALFELVDTKYPEIPEAIRTTKVLEDEMEQKLISAIEECKKSYK